MLTEDTQSEETVRADHNCRWTGHRQHIFRREHDITVVFLEIVWIPRRDARRQGEKERDQSLVIHDVPAEILGS